MRCLIYETMVLFIKLFKNVSKINTIKSPLSLLIIHKNKIQNILIITIYKLTICNKCINITVIMLLVYELTLYNV